MPGKSMGATVKSYWKTIELYPETGKYRESLKWVFTTFELKFSERQIKTHTDRFLES